MRVESFTSLECFGCANYIANRLFLALCSPPCFRPCLSLDGSDRSTRCQQNRTVKMAMRYSIPAARSDVLGAFLSSTGPSFYSPHRPEKTEWKLRDQRFFYGTLLTGTHSLSCRFRRQRSDRAKRVMFLSSRESHARELSSQGETKRMLGDFAGAVADFDLALQLEPKNEFETAFALSVRIGFGNGA